jgi:hypothetical protein
MHDGDPPVVRLGLHLEDQQRVFFEADQIGNAESLLPAMEARRTTLTAWFLANQMYEEARELLYVDFPTKYVTLGLFFRWRMATNIECVGLFGRIRYVSGSLESRSSRLEEFGFVVPKRESCIIYGCYFTMCRAQHAGRI